MGPILAWYNLAFLIPLGIGLIFGMSAVTGLGGDHDLDAGAEADADADADGDHDSDHDHDADGGILKTALSILGVGRVPLSIVLMLASISFGGVGMLSNLVLGHALKTPWAYAWISLIVAFIAMIFLTSNLTKALARVLPKTESYNVTDVDLEGCVGRLVTGADARGGLADIRDREGNVHRVSCRVAKGELPRDREVLLIEFDKESRVYLAQPYDSDEASGHSAS